MAKSTLSHSLHDLGLSAWFGGTLANAVALNRAASQAGDSSRVGAVANAGWDAWTPVNAVAIGAHLAGSVGMLARDAGRMSAQQGVGSMALLKTALTVGALGATGYSRILGRKVSKHADVPAESGTSPTAITPREVAAAQKQLRLLQWAVPAMTGALVVVSSFASEQMRPEEVRRGKVQRFIG
jgi:hypothetical protein